MLVVGASALVESSSPVSALGGSAKQAQASSDEINQGRDQVIGMFSRVQFRRPH
jgi:hypothetical protein